MNFTIVFKVKYNLFVISYILQHSLKIHEHILHFSRSVKMCGLTNVYKQLKQKIFKT